MRRSSRTESRSPAALRGVSACALAFALASMSASHALDLSDKIRPLADPLIENGIAVGFVVGIVRRDERQMLAFGETRRASGTRPDGNTVYEIGSLSKVFTGVLLADLALRKGVEIDAPIQKYLRKTVRVPVADGKPITLAHLATHTSGLPRLPDNLRPAVPSNPYADYTVAQMYAFLGNHELRRPPGVYEYSNYGAGLLGHLLARRARTSYEALLLRAVCKPLGMKDTRVVLTADMRRRLAPPYNAAIESDSNWDFPTLAGAGGVRSTCNDLVEFIKANVAGPDQPLAEALRLSHRKRHTMKDGRAMGLGWHIARDGRTRYHSGMTGGYHSWLAVVPSRRTGVVVLSNTATERISQFGEQVTRIALGIDVKPAAERKAVAVDPVVLEKYAGVYRMTADFALEVTVHDGRLMVQATGQARLPVFAESETKFFYKAVDAQITFVPNAEGEVGKLVLHQGGRDREAVRE